MAAGEASDRGSADLSAVDASASASTSGSPPNALMLSPRAAAFSVQALLTGPEENEEGRRPSSGKAKSYEDVAVDEVSETSRNSQPEAEEAMATSPTRLEDATRREETPPSEICDSGNAREVSSDDGEGVDDEDLLVDVEDCSSEFHVDRGGMAGKTKSCSGLQC